MPSSAMASILKSPESKQRVPTGVLIGKRNGVGN